MKRLFAVLVCALLIAPSLVIQSQTAIPFTPITVTAYRDAVVYAGAGSTHLQLGTLVAGVPATVTARNTAGTWVHFERAREDGTILQAGWVMTGLLNQTPEFLLGAIPVDSAVTEGDTVLLDRADLAELAVVPVISPFEGEAGNRRAETVRAIFAAGAARGNLPNAITKIGDSLSADALYLEPMNRGDAVLGAYDFLAEALDYYGASAGASIGARVGMTSYVIFDPMWANGERCMPGETPLTCEYRITRPAIALIMFGSNDVMRMTDAEFDTQMRRLVDETIVAGVIPVLSTFSYHPESELWWQSVNFNRRIVVIAEEYAVPLIHFWLAARPLPDYGLDVDRVHLLHNGFAFLKFDTGHEAFYGASLRNLLSLVMLDQLYDVLELG